MLPTMIAPTGRPWLDEFETTAERFRTVIAAAADADALTSSVPSCPDWDLQELTGHLGETHLWAAGILGGADPRDRPQEEPAGDASLADWYIGTAERLHRALAKAGPDMPCWTLIKDQRTALFWQRRQVHETVIHLWDAQHALGQHTEIDPALALDGVAEVAEVMYPRMLRSERTEPLPKSLNLLATDLDAGPVIIGDAEPSLLVRAPAAELLLLVWHHLPWNPAYGRDEAARLISRSLVP